MHNPACALFARRCGVSVSGSLVNKFLGGAIPRVRRVRAETYFSLATSALATTIAAVRSERGDRAWLYVERPGETMARQEDAVFLPDVEVREIRVEHTYRPLRGRPWTLAVFEGARCVGWIKPETLGYQNVVEWMAEHPHRA